MSRLNFQDLDPDEIFLDASNIPKFDTQQFEGRLERPIGRGAVVLLGAFFLAVFLVFTGKIFSLQVLEGEVYAERSRVNHVYEEPIFSNRGIIYDRNGKILASNEISGGVYDPPKRIYTNLPGFAHILGYVNYPKKDSSGFYWREEYVGKDGVEKSYDERLKGIQGKRIIETDAVGATVSENTVLYPEEGGAITLAIDADLQTRLFQGIKGLAENGFVGGAGALMDVKTGELLAVVSYPEYDNTFSSPKDAKTASLEKKKPFLNRAVSGLYSPGSTLKPIFAFAALEEGVITPNRKITSTGELVIPNPFKGEDSVFKDWKAHGPVDIRTALAVSSNVYFYEIGGGYKEQKGIGIAGIEKYAKLFKLDQRTGVDLPGESLGTIPGPEWKKRLFNGEDWKLGDTYHTVIGQYGFQVTPLVVLRAVGALATGGLFVRPHVLKDKTVTESEFLDLNAENLNVVREGMRKAVTEGTVQGLSIPGLAVAAKSGTAEVGSRNQYVNSWVAGYFPYENPRYAFVVVMEQGPLYNREGAQFAIQPLLWYLLAEKKEYLK